MNSIQFALGRYLAGATPALAIAIGSRHVDLKALADAVSAHGGHDVSWPEKITLMHMLADWENYFFRLQQMAQLAHETGLLSSVPALDFSAAASRLLPPIERPYKIMCAAANYKAHVAEMRASNFTGPANAPKTEATAALRPYHFFKAPSCMIGPDDEIVLPSAEHKIDWEVELGAVIGKPGKNIPAANALDHVAGYVVVNDISCRAATWRADRPNLRSDWMSGKSYDTFLPVGPWFVPSAFVPDYRAMQLQLWVNGELHQDGYARDMIFSTEEQIAYLSEMMTLEPGDLVVTGTPAGVGQGKGVYLKPGDVVEAEISHLGRQRNRVVL